MPTIQDIQLLEEVGCSKYDIFYTFFPEVEDKEELSKIVWVKPIF